MAKKKSDEELLKARKALKRNQRLQREAPGQFLSYAAVYGMRCRFKFNGEEAVRHRRLRKQTVALRFSS
jgi:hypothetical protein